MTDHCGDRTARATLAVGMLALNVLAGGCARSAPPGDRPAGASDAPSAEHRLSTGAMLDPAGRSMPVGNMPLAMAASPDGRFVVLSMSGWREQGLEVVSRATGAVVQRAPQAGAFLGLAWSPDGATLYASGGATDRVYVYAWEPAAVLPARLRDSLDLAEPKAPADARGERYPAGLAVSRDGRSLYVAENLSDSLAVISLASGRVTQRVGTGPYPYAVVASPDGRLYVSDWGGTTVHPYRSASDRPLIAERPIVVGRHPSALVLSPDGGRLFAASASTDRIAAIDTRAQRVVAWLHDALPEGMAEGATPDAMTLSADATRLYVAEADANAVAVFDLSALTSGVRRAAGGDTLAGRIPTQWYPTAVVDAGADSLWVANGKGRGAGPNPNGPRAWLKSSADDPHSYTLGQLDGTITVLPAARGAALEALTRRTAHANGWDVPRAPSRYPPIEHVIYVIKENRTYDQVFGDLPQGDGDTALTYFPRAVSPNHHALAERFGTYDRFFTNAEVSRQGHMWTTAGYVTDYIEKTTPDVYRDKRREPSDQGDVLDPAMGYLWDAARDHHLWLRNYGESTEPMPHERDAGDTQRGDTSTAGVRAQIPSLQPYTSPTYPSFDLAIPDQRRADVWIAELREHERTGRMPALEIVQLPNDHTAGLRAGLCTPRACMADNDLALGRMVESLSRSRFWASSAVFVLEDDAQAGPDHVDSHRSVLLTISPWARDGVQHRFVNTTDVLATVEELLGLPPFSPFDRFGRPLRDIWRTSPDLRPFVAIAPLQSITEVNGATGAGALRSSQLDLTRPDRVDDAEFNRILWTALKGQGVYPASRRAATLEYVRATPP